eukprot:GHVL01040937.1.p1 GENE.GHVL01040937.1~~GHVL01040937.1.p1  ORF type:complete len:396 (+),score=108.86 GHVL01040937.1:92-1279(+)
MNVTPLNLSKIEIKNNIPDPRKLGKFEKIYDFTPISPVYKKHEELQWLTSIEPLNTWIDTKCLLFTGMPPWHEDKKSRNNLLRMISDYVKRQLGEDCVQAQRIHGLLKAAESFSLCDCSVRTATLPPLGNIHEDDTGVMFINFSSILHAKEVYMTLKGMCSSMLPEGNGLTFLQFSVDVFPEYSGLRYFCELARRGSGWRRIEPPSSSDTKSDTNILLDTKSDTNILLDTKSDTNILLDAKSDTNILSDTKSDTNSNIYNDEYECILYFPTLVLESCIYYIKKEYNNIYNNIYIYYDNNLKMCILLTYWVYISEYIKIVTLDRSDAFQDTSAKIPFNTWNGWSYISDESSNASFLWIHNGYIPCFSAKIDKINKKKKKDISLLYIYKTYLNIDIK